MNYLITGGFGLIGSELANSLEGNITIVSRSTKGIGRIKIPKTLIQKDLNDLTREDIEYANPDVIYHCASTVDNYNIFTDPYIDIKTNLTGTSKLLELIKDLPKKPKLIYLSTFFVYGNVYDEDKKPINELSRTDPLGLYPATKLCAENFIKCYAKLYGFDYLIARLSNVYGEDEDPTTKKAALNYLIHQAINKETLSIYNNGNFYRDYIHVEDVVSALMFLEEKASNDTFLVAYGRPVLFKDLIDYIGLKLGGITTQAVQPPSFHKVVGINNFVADTSKINQLGWHANISYVVGIKRVIKKLTSQ